MTHQSTEVGDPLGRRRLAWTRFWEQGPLHSLGTTFAGNYADAIGTFWQMEFAGCKPGDRILDIGCGNGPLARIVIDLHPVEGPLWTGIDIANPRPAWLAAETEAVRSRLEFRGGVMAEELPFAAASMDLVVSQFGIEYSDLVRSQAEVARVLKPGGRIALVVHHSDSLPVHVSRQELRHLAFLRSDSDFFAAGRGMIPFIARLADPAAAASLGSDPAADAARRRFDAAMLSVSQRVSSEPIPDLLADAQIFMQECFRMAVSAGPEPALARLAAFEVFLDDSRVRLEDLVRSAMDEAGALVLQDRFQRALGRSGRKSLTPLMVNGHAFGWAVRA